MTLDRGFTDEIKMLFAEIVLGSPIGEKLSVALERIAKFADAPLRLYASLPADALLNIGTNVMELGDGAGRVSPPIDNTIQVFPDSTINFQTGATSGGTIQKNGGVWSLPGGSTIGKFRRGVFTYKSLTNALDSNFSAEQNDVPSLPDPGTLYQALSGIPVGHMDIEATAAAAYKTAGSATDIIENKVGADIRIFRIQLAASLAAPNVSKFDQTYTAAPAATIAHGLPGMPIFAGAFHNENADGEWLVLPGSPIKFDATNLYTSGFSGLTIDPTHQVRIVAFIL
jgi:hypothetical protein